MLLSALYRQTWSPPIWYAIDYHRCGLTDIVKKLHLVAKISAHTPSGLPRLHSSWLVTESFAQLLHHSSLGAGAR